MGILLIIAIIAGAYMAWNVGANDAANSMADAVGSKALTVFWAVVLAGIFELGGAVLVGAHVTDTVRKGIIETQAFEKDPMVLAYGMICAILAAALWLNAASFFGMPVSTTHSIVGAIVGFGILKAGFWHIHWGKMGQIVASWFISPLVGGAMSFFIFKIISAKVLSVEKPAVAAKKGVPVCVFFTFSILILAIIFKGLKNLHLNLSGFNALGLSIIGGLIAAVLSAIIMAKGKNEYDNLETEQQLEQVEKIFAILVIITSCTVAFAHGANDVANAIGPLAAVAEIIRTNAIPSKASVNIWFLVLGGAGIAVGLATFGYRVMKLVGEKVTEITPSRGVAADIAGMTTVLVCSRLGLPVSTTHVIVGAIIGVGLARGITAIDRTVVRSIFISWLATVPIAAVLTVIFYLLGDWLFF
ncbi:MAG: inorganic phosphate transporter [Sedimentisphaerales bacterium]|nr:inorganic phosphate transporter [Sedimentisphaerales bacterium]